MNAIKTVGVVGAGTMGAALAQKFAQEGFSVILTDRADPFIERGMSAIRASLAEAQERRVLSENEVTAALDRIHQTTQLTDLAQCQLVVEAIFEDFEAKTSLFRDLSAIVGADTILATNTSSFLVRDLARAVTHPERFCGLHFFYHAAKNRLVEIIPAEQTSADVTIGLKRFAFEIGKDPICCKDRYGFAVNRFFVPWLNEAVRILEERVIPVDDETVACGLIDDIAKRVFSIGMGPFALMNATGIPITYHAQRTLEGLGKFYQVSERLRVQAERNSPWSIASQSAPSPEWERVVGERLLSAVFFVCAQILNEEVCDATSLNRGARIGLQWKRGPIEMMRARGALSVSKLVAGIAERYGVEIPGGLAKAFEPLQYVTLEVVGTRALITFNRPEDLNALNADVVSQLDECFTAAQNDPKVSVIVLTGTGKAFIAGADIGFFVTNIKQHTIDRIVNFTEYTQQVFDRIDSSTKPVVALLNGMTLGGGLELALCADRIYALPDIQLAFPETGIGIYPGLGGTQRTQRFVGKGLTKYLILTGDRLRSQEAEEMGLIDGVISSDEYFGILEGNPSDYLPSHVATDQRKSTTHPTWSAVRYVFESNTLDELLTAVSTDHVPQQLLERWKKGISQKAPLALRAAERLIDQARGCASELEELPSIFSSHDALVGLTSIGKKVTFEGK